MAGRVRERTTVDLRGIGPRMRAYATTHGMPLSAVARLAIATLLEKPDVSVAAPAPPGADIATAGAVKVTVRVSRRIAREMSRRAWAFGLSQGVYLTTLIDATPIRADHNEAVRSLRVSTDRLAAVNGELRSLARLLRQGRATSGERIDAAVMSLTDAVLRHLELAARLVADLQPIAAARRDAAHHIQADSAAP